MLMLKSSRLINAFPDLLPTFDQMYLALYVQELTIKGKFDALIGDAPTNNNIQLWAFGKNVPKKSRRLPPIDKTPSTKKNSFWNRFIRK